MTDTATLPLTLPDLPAILRHAEGFAELEAALLEGKAATIDGAWGSAGSLAAATLAQTVPGTLVVVLAHSGDVVSWSHDLRSFTGSMPVVFPGWETWPPERNITETTPGDRLRVLQRLNSPDRPKVILTTMTALMQPVPSREELAARGRNLSKGQPIDPEELALWLMDRGFRRVDAVELPGEYSRRGGIFDLFSPDADNPIRLEFFGDEIDVIRSFSPANQRSLGELTSVLVLGVKAAAGGFKNQKDASSTAHLFDFLPDKSWIVLCELNELHEQGKYFLERASEIVGLFGVPAVFKLAMQRPTVLLSSLPRATSEVTAHLRVESVERFSGNVARVKDELDHVAKLDRVVVTCATESEAKRLQEVFAGGEIAASGRLSLVVGSVSKGFRLVPQRLVVLGSHEIFLREQTPAGEKAAAGQPRRRIESRAIDSFVELNEGDYVVHVSHGIALYRGMKMLDRRNPGNTSESASGDSPLIDPQTQVPVQEEHLVLEFREGVKLYVPVSKIDLIQKYVGGSKSQPELSKIGGTSWAKKKDKVTDAVRDLASDMIDLQAMRATQVGSPMPVDTDWQKEFEGSFPYQETPDQLTAIQEIKGDLEKTRPMDRLLCGDVGYGKTEVAIRAVFKAIDNGRQVAVLVPTTVLAEQHFRTFSARLAEYPFRVEVVSRFRTKKQQKEILEGVKEGTVDVLIGTHRLVSDDVKFKELGLVIIDEEQRFGVDHKEKLKRLRAMVHILTMTATPIPRTLHQGLLGIRDISNLETPPPERLPVETRIMAWDDKMIRNAIQREMGRDGQIYFVHNRVMDIDKLANRLAQIVPEAKIVIGHGQMGEHELEKAMVAFIRKEADILLATTIIESGVDIPNANTIFINEAENYGLADLHQLRGRVGRQRNRAYAYMLTDGKKLTEQSTKRLKAIEEFTELGAGFKIAMRDLEIRGAGNILGNEQSGHIASVGYEMYCHLLENAIRDQKKMPRNDPIETNVDLQWPAFLPRSYVPVQKLRIEVYRRLSRLRDIRTIEDFRQEMRDRYGPLPEPAEWLLKQAEIRLLGSKWGITAIHSDGRDLIFGYADAALARDLSARSKNRMKVVDNKTMYLRPSEGFTEPTSWFDLLREMLRERVAVPMLPTAAVG